MKRGKYLLLIAMMLSIVTMGLIACTDDEEYSYDYSYNSTYEYSYTDTTSSIESMVESSTVISSMDESSMQSSVFQSSDIGSQSSLESSEESFDSSEDSSTQTSSEWHSSESMNSSSEEISYTSSSSVSETSTDSSDDSSEEISKESSSNSFIQSEDSTSEPETSTSESSSDEDESSSKGPTCGDTDHEEGEFVVEHVFMTYMEEPNCTKSGYKREFCIGCDLELSYEFYEALGHVEATIPGFSATCCTYGSTESKYCERCKIELLPAEELPFSDHCYEWGSCKWCDLALLQYKVGKRAFQEELYAVCIGPYTDVTMKHPSARRVVIPAEVELLDEHANPRIYPVKEIESGAFKAHYEIYSIEIGENIDFIGENAFAACYNLKEVYDKSKIQVTKGGSQLNGYLSEYVKPEDFHYEPYESKIWFSETGCIIYEDEDECVLIGCRNTHAEVIIPEGVTKIAAFAFTSCFWVSKITIAASVTFMDRYAFEYICPFHREFQSTACNCPEPLVSVTFKNPNNWHKRFSILDHYEKIPFDMSVDETAFYLLMTHIDYYWERID